MFKCTPVFIMMSDARFAIKYSRIFSCKMLTSGPTNPGPRVPFMVTMYHGMQTMSISVGGCMKEPRLMVAFTKRGKDAQRYAC